MSLAAKVQEWGQPKFEVINIHRLDSVPELKKLPKDYIDGMKLTAKVLPFRVNRYVIEQLIDWDNVPEDPIFQLVFPQPGMLKEEHREQLLKLEREGASKEEWAAAIHQIRMDLNPHPAGQMKFNVPKVNGKVVPGVQHKYRETVLFFPAQGQTCHSYCTFCFRWPQFVGEQDLKFSAKDAQLLFDYLASKPDVTDILFTGGDPMVMKAKFLKAYIEPILEDPRLEHVQNIRIGTKSLTYWPYRYVTDPDSDEIIELFEKVVKSGKHLAIMAHFNHWKELEPPIVREAIRRVRETGAEIRTQSPLVNHINADSATWEKMWREQVKLGLIPYYMFVERDTGAQHYFQVPLARAWEIYRDAVKLVSGLSRTVRGPSMSATPGKVEIQGVAEIKGEKVFVLRFIQGRNPDWVQRPFFAKYDEKATWLTHLEPAFGEEKFFFEHEFPYK